MNAELKTMPSGSADKYYHLFDTEHLKDSLKDKSIRGGLNTTFAEGVSFILSLGSTVVLARLLMPEHFGLISMVTSLTAFADRFKELGLSTATVQRKEVTHEQVSNLFWINVSIGTLIMLIIAGASPVISWFYNDGRLVWISIALSSSFFFGGLTVQHQALLRRQMLFGRLAKIRIVSTFLSVALGVGLAWQGFGFWALVWKEVGRNAFAAAGTWFACRWKPSLPVRSSGIRSLLQFGTHITGFDVVYFLSRSLDQILIGRVWGAIPLGFYRQAYQLMSLPINQLQVPVQSVAEPTLSALQNEYQKYRMYYKEIVSILSFVSMPLVMYLAIFSDHIIRLLLGEKWLDSAGIFRLLAIAAFIQPVASTCGFVMVTCGKAKRYFWWGVLNAVCLIITFCAGISWGPVGIAVAYAVNTYAILVPSLWYSFRDTPISMTLFFEAISLPVLSSGIMGFVLIFTFRNAAIGSTSLEILLSLILGTCVYFGVYLLFPGGKQKLIDYFSYPIALFKFTPSLRERHSEGRIV